MVEPLFDDFFSHTKSISSTSRPSYRTYLTNNVTSGLSSTVEKNYIDIVAFSVASGNKSIALHIIGNMLKVLPKGKAHSALKSFETFIGSSSCDIYMAQNSLNKCCVNVYDVHSSYFINQKIKNRLRNQSRISGKKTWLPLIFLSKLYSGKKPNNFSIWIHNIYEKIHLILKKGGKLEHVRISDSRLKYIGICRSGDVFALYDDSILGCYWYQVMTPEGYLNWKREMSVDEDIKNISIDHVTPIDITLVSLATVSRLNELAKISNFVQSYKTSNPSLSGKQLETQAYNAFVGSGSVVNLARLTKELYLISDDSHYRLTDSGVNLKKSNSLAYTAFYTDMSKSKYYGYICDCKINSTTDGVIYQDLDTNYPSVIDKTVWNAMTLSLKQIKTVDVPIDKL